MDIQILILAAGAVAILGFVYKWIKSLKVSWQGKFVAISGCDSGFGFNMAKRLAGDGMNVIAGCLLPEGEGALELKQFSAAIHVVPLNVTQHASVEHFKQEIIQLTKDKGGLWGLINNAGIGFSGEVDFTDIEEYMKVFEVNAMGPIRLTKALMPLLRRSCGRIVNVASVASHASPPHLSAYCISKAALYSFTNCLRLELKKFGILCSTIEPYFYKTNIIGSVTNYKRFLEWERMSDEHRQSYGREYVDAIFNSPAHGIHEAADDPTPVFEAIEHALTARYPSRHYPVPFRGQLLVALCHFLPSWCLDQVHLASHRSFLMDRRAVKDGSTGGYLF